MNKKNIYLKDDFVDFKKALNEINSCSSELSRKENKRVNIGFNHEIGKYIQIDDVTIAIDSWNSEADVIFISHAHMDHIPYIPPKILNRYKDGKELPQFIISKITRDIAESRTHGKFKIPDSVCLLDDKSVYPQIISFKGIKITILENGHTFGSLSLFIEGSETILYTSDFLTEDRLLPNNRGIIKGLRPIECDRLVMECTFGAPKYHFPCFNSIISTLNEYINDSISKGFPIVLLAYSFGKSQILLNILEDSHKILLERSIANNTKVIEKNGLKFPKWEPYGNYNKNQLNKLKDYILIIPPYSMYLDPYKTLISNGAKIVSLSGKVLNKSHHIDFPADLYIPYSDHCDFNCLTEFIEKCNPKQIYLEHGNIEEFFYLIMKYSQSDYKLRYLS